MSDTTQNKRVICNLFFFAFRLAHLHVQMCQPKRIKSGRLSNFVPKEKLLGKGFHQIFKTMHQML